MPREGDKWRVVRGDCLWNIARSVYSNAYRWTEIADANGISRRTALIYPNQLLTLPGITGGAAAAAPAPTPSPPPVQKPRIDWFALVAGSDREMLAIWSFNASKFWIKWEQWDGNGHLILLSEQKGVESKQSMYSGQDTDGWNVIRFSVLPVDNDGNQIANTDWTYIEYDYRNNPPGLPSDPDFQIDNNNVMTVTFNNIDEKINADSIEIAVYQDDTLKYSTSKVSINKETNFAKYVATVDPGHYYKIRCRAVRGTIYGGWTNFSSNEQSCPVAPSEISTLRVQSISDQGNKTYNVFIEWPEEKTAKTYEVQWTTNVEYFDKSSNVSSQTTEEGKGPRLLLTDIEAGHEYFFRVRSINDKGNSLNWTPIKSLLLGSKPSAPTTWSNVSSAILGEDLNLYWTHNATDGSLERYARLYFKIIDSAHPEKEPQEIYKTIKNEKPEDEQSSNSVYTINTSDEEWSSLLEDGFTLKWKVQTAGISNEYSDFSIEREINIYSKPEVVLDIINKDEVSQEEINRFPFYLSVLAKPATQTPISYYIEIIANEGYNIADNIGEIKTVNPGDKVYQKYYDPMNQTNPWRFLLELTPFSVDLQNDINYTVNVTVSMNSGLNAITSKSFDVIFDDLGYTPSGNVVIDKNTLTANIHPYCMENYEEDGGTKQKLSENCKLSVYRREYDGSFTEIATEIDNDENTYVMDPHPALDYARYRIVAKTNDTGLVTYSDIEAIPVNEPSIVIQWSEKWTNFDYDSDDEDLKLEVPWAGSMVKLPYNVDTTESKSVEVSLVEYAGRKHPVSYYGTQLGEKSTMNTVIPADDKELLYALRRLSRWTGDVYIREPSGTGYWANVTVSISKTHREVTIPILLTVTRVEGGI